MGMDVHGLNPKQNKKIDEFPVYKKIKDIEDSGNYNKRHELLDGDNDLRKKYYDEWSEYEDTNIGTYFRNNCWWWRPLWDFCAEVAPDIISAELWQSGHSNDGKGLNDEDAKLLGAYLLTAIKNGTADTFKENHEIQQKDEEYKYPFDTDNVKKFAEFCIESGGFEIC